MYDDFDELEGQKPHHPDAEVNIPSFEDKKEPVGEPMTIDDFPKEVEKNEEILPIPDLPEFDDPVFEAPAAGLEPMIEEEKKSKKEKKKKGKKEKMDKQDKKKKNKDKKGKKNKNGKKKDKKDKKKEKGDKKKKKSKK